MEPESEGVPALLEALFIYDKAEVLDRTAKAALRLCNKHFKNLVDATVVKAKTYPNALLEYALLNVNWHSLKHLAIQGGRSYQHPYHYLLTALPSALFVKFSRLETLKIGPCSSLKALPEEIGELSHLRSLELYYCDTLVALPSSLGKLTALEKIILSSCNNLTVEGLAPLQHLPGLTALRLSNLRLAKYPNFICTLTSLKTLHLYSFSITTLPAALGNLTNLESLVIGLDELKELPESIGNLNALKTLNISRCHKLTTLPESLDDLLWRKAHETEESKKMTGLDFYGCYKLVFSPKMKQALKIMKQNGTRVNT